MDVVRGYWHNEQFHYQGTYYRAEGGGLRGPLKKAELPLICTAGSSVAAREFAAKHADFYLMRAEHPDEIAALIADIRARALKGRTDIRFGLSIDVITRDTEEAAWPRPSASSTKAWPRARSRPALPMRACARHAS
jgi:alkanesulfonate monooxygenase